MEGAAEPSGPATAPLAAKWSARAAATADSSMGTTAPLGKDWSPWGPTWARPDAAATQAARTWEWIDCSETVLDVNCQNVSYQKLHD